MKAVEHIKANNQDIHFRIISEIGDLIIHKNLEPGDKLPSERILAEKFGVSRRNLREVIAKLEAYDLVKSIPQSGTALGNIGQIAMVGVIDNILTLKEDSFKSLVETRILLELKTVELAAERRTKKDLRQIESKLKRYEKKALKGEDAIQEDLLFHLAIAKASGNNTMHALMLQITPKLISIFEYNRVVKKWKHIPEPKQNGKDKYVKVKDIKRHISIYEAIRDQEPQIAVSRMKEHFEEVLDLIAKWY